MMTQPRYPHLPGDFPQGIYRQSCWEARRTRQTGTDEHGTALYESYGADVPKLFSAVKVELTGWLGSRTLSPGIFSDAPGWGWGDRADITLPALNTTWTLDAGCWFPPGYVQTDPHVPIVLGETVDEEAYGFFAKKLGAFTYRAYNVEDDPPIYTIERDDGEIWMNLELTIDPRQGPGALTMRPPSPVLAGHLTLRIFAVAGWADDPSDEDGTARGHFVDGFGMLTHYAPFAWEKTPRVYTCVFDDPTLDPALTPALGTWLDAASWIGGESTVKVMLQK